MMTGCSNVGGCCPSKKEQTFGFLRDSLVCRGQHGPKMSAKIWEGWATGASDSSYLSCGGTNIAFADPSVQLELRQSWSENGRMTRSRRSSLNSITNMTRKVVAKDALCAQGHTQTPQNFHFHKARFIGKNKALTFTEHRNFHQPISPEFLAVRSAIVFSQNSLHGHHVDGFSGRRIPSRRSSLQANCSRLRYRKFVWCKVALHGGKTAHHTLGSPFQG